MARGRRKIGWRLLRRRCAVMASLLAYLLASAGLPLPAACSKKGEAFETRPCGCRVSADSLACCCCQTQAHPKVASQRKSCCDAETAPASSPSVKAEPNPAVRWVLGIKALECRGASTLWITTGAVSLPPGPVSCESRLAPGDRFALIDFSASARSTTPPLHPPR